MKSLDNKKSVRDFNIELLRIVLMFMIVLLHMVSHGLNFIPSLLENSYNKSISVYHLAIFNFAIIGVNTFIFISGYFGIKFKLSSALNFSKQALFTSLLILVLSYIFHKDLSIKFIIQSIFPILSNYWWFLSSYIFLLFISPYINRGIESLDKDSFKILVISLFLFNCVGGYFFGTFNANAGYSILNFIFLYCLGRYMNNHDVLNDLRFPVIYYLALITATFLIGYYLYTHNNFKLFLKFYDYNNPLIIISSVLFFFVFKKLKFDRDIRGISKLTFGVYLFSDNDLVRNYLPTIFKFDHSVMYVILVALMIYIISSILEFLRQSIFNLFEKKP